MTALILSKQLPEIGETVLIRINKVMPFGAYCSLVEYNIDAYLPINEVNAGWIKNIHEFIKEGQSDVAKVIFVDKEKQAVDISLKRVSTKEKKDKLNEYSLEKRAEQLFNQAVSAAGVQDAELAQIKQKAATKFSTYSELLEAAYDNKPQVKEVLGVALSSALHEIAQKNIKPKVFKVSYKLELSGKNRVGNILKIKQALGEVEKIGVNVIYEGAPHYLLRAEGGSYPEAEAKIKNATGILGKHSELSFTIQKA
ncbi:MAG: S1 RNA-binding domain-containing protein [Candidatus Micrarchaeia archaeon]